MLARLLHPVQRAPWTSAFIVCLAVNLVFITLTKHTLEGSDGEVYLRLAGNLVDHGTISMDTEPPYTPSTYRSPGYMLVVAGLLATVGPRLWILWVLQAIVVSVAVVLMGWTLSRQNRAVGRWTLWLAATSPVLGVFSAAVLSEQLVGAWLMVAFCLPVILPDRPYRFALTGLVLGVALLTRDAYKLLPVFAAAALLIPAVGPAVGLEAKLRSRVQAAATVLVCAYLVMLPWTARNRISTGEWVTTTQGRLALNLWVGSWETSDTWSLVGLRQKIPEESYRTQAEYEAVETAMSFQGDEREQRFRTLFLARFMDEPHRVIGRWFYRMPMTWAGTRVSIFSFRPAWLARGAPLWYALKAGLWGVNALVAVGGFIGLIIAWRRRLPMLWFATPIVYTGLLYLPMHSTESRYSHPVYVFLLAFFGLAATSLLAWYTKKPVATARPPRP